MQLEGRVNVVGGRGGEGNRVNVRRGVAGLSCRADSGLRHAEKVELGK